MRSKICELVLKDTEKAAIPPNKKGKWYFTCPTIFCSS